MTGSTDRSKPYVAVVLAAGSGRRFGGAKPLAEINGVPMIAHVVATAMAAGAQSVLVVVGERGEDIAAGATMLTSTSEVGRIQRIDNPDHLTGQASSLAAGLVAAQDHPVDAAVILLADQPGVTAASITTVAGVIDQSGGIVAARAYHDDGPSHPVALHRSIWTQVASQVTGDRGARDLLAGLGAVDVRVAGPRPIDVDRPDDLARVAATTSISSCGPTDDDA